MKTVKRTITALVGAMLMFTAVTLTASDTVGIYAIIDKVIFEPSEAAPQLGYLYYSLPAGKEAIALKEWADLKSVAGAGQGVAFGRRYTAPGKVRPASEKPASPDSYSQDASSFGVSKVNPITGYQDNMTDVVAQLKAALKKS